jgi:hypothetical protein
MKKIREIKNIIKEKQEKGGSIKERKEKRN